MIEPFSCLTFIKSLCNSWERKDQSTHEDIPIEGALGSILNGLFRVRNETHFGKTVYEENLTDCQECPFIPPT